MDNKKQTVILNEIGDMGLGIYPIVEQESTKKEKDKKDKEE